MKHSFEIGDLVQLCGRWAERNSEEMDQLPRGIVTGIGTKLHNVARKGVHVYWLDECKVYKDEDPEALKLLSRS